MDSLERKKREKRSVIFFLSSLSFLSISFLVLLVLFIIKQNWFFTTIFAVESFLTLPLTVKSFISFAQDKDYE